jgi:hypothetical protein
MVVYVYDLSAAELAQIEGGSPTESTSLNFLKLTF